jgi:CheY-like chemotaxis protein
MAKILIVDDSDFFRSVYSQALTAKGFQVAVAADGPAGLERMVADPPQLIFLDFVMPNMSGEEVLRQMQTHPEVHGVPVIMLTSISAQIIGKDLLTAGPIAGYLKKEEASVDDVVKKAQEVLGTSEQNYDPATDPNATHPQAAPAPQPQPQVQAQPQPQQPPQQPPAPTA